MDRSLQADPLAGIPGALPGLGGPTAPEGERTVYTVSRLNREARLLLEEGFPFPVWVEGELSNLARPASGHLYFTLKDEAAQLRCAMFRGRNRHLAFRPANGMQVLARGRLSLYEPRGDFQLVVEELEEAGEGRLRRELERLKRRLAAEGLFDEALKRPLPAYPRRVGVITSPTGAAVRDVLTVLRRRWALLEVLVHPVPVQGAGAAPAIVRALALASERAECDVLILTRGGGSLEDLWAFNEEAVVRAIRACRLPVVSAVGHEIDWTLADLAADRRAPTPSAAAEMISPDAAGLLAALDGRLKRLRTAMGRRLALLAQRHRGLDRRLAVQHPGRRLQDRAQRLDELELRLRRTVRARIDGARQRLAALEAGLHRHHPGARLRRDGERLEALARRLRRAPLQVLEGRRQRLAALGRALQAVSPLATLERGYAIVRRTDGQVVRRAEEVRPGEEVEALLGRGRLRCVVRRRRLR